VARDLQSEGRFRSDTLTQPPTLLDGKYEILSKISEGGMGAIYKVRHLLLDETRVVKVMRATLTGDEGLSRRFVQEARTATRLKHPNIVSVLDFAIDSDGTSYIVMEYIEGVNLSEILKSVGPPGLALTLNVAHQALSALGYLHHHQVVHRDIAPDNLMLTLDHKGGLQLKLIDLGIAKALDRTVGLTSTGVFLGKIKYSSPEQLEGGSRVDGRSDLYSLGAVLYQMLTGELPFRGDSSRELLTAHLVKPPRPFAETDPAGRVPESLRAVVLKALEKQAGDRFATSEDFDREILRIRERYAPEAEGVEASIASAIRAGPRPSHEPVTPSAQSRLDRHFGAQATPLPPTTLVRLPRPASETGPTAVNPAIPTEMRRPAENEPGEIRQQPTAEPAGEGPRSPRRRLGWPIAAIAGAAAVVAVVLLWPRPVREIPGRTAGPESVAPSPVAPAPQVVAAVSPAATEPVPLASPNPMIATTAVAQPSAVSPLSTADGQVPAVQERPTAGPLPSPLPARPSPRAAAGVGRGRGPAERPPGPGAKPSPTRAPLIAQANPTPFAQALPSPPAMAGPEPSAALMPIFQKAREQVASHSYSSALETLDQLRAESLKPENSGDRGKVWLPMTFYRGVCLAALGRTAEADREFRVFLSYYPKATIKKGAYPESVVKAFERAHAALRR
jgi:eukaryotic-like serine/threonine-protein kinase